MKKILKIFVSALLTLVIAFNSTQNAFAYQTTPIYAFSEQLYSSEDAEQVIEKLFDAVNEKDWSTYTKLRCSDDQAYFNNYFSDDSLTDGIKQVNNLNLINIFKIENEKVEDEWLTDDYPLLTTSSKICSFICELDCYVTNENQYFYNGINYFLIILAIENDEFKVVQFNRPSTEIVQSLIESNKTEETELYEKELKALHVLEASDYGLAINADNEIITDGFVSATMNNDTDESNISVASADPPIINHYTTYTYPTSIKVKLNLTGNDAIKTVNMTTYIKNVLQNEWYSTWNSQSLKAGAYCVKMVGIYRTLKPRSSDGGYDATQSDQMYEPGTTIASSVTTAVSSICNSGMASYGGLLFYPRYAAGTSGSKGTKGGGILSQWGSQLLADTYGYTYEQILNYYYSGSDFSPSGDIRIFSYSIGF